MSRSHASTSKILLVRRGRGGRCCVSHIAHKAAPGNSLEMLAKNAVSKDEDRTKSHVICFRGRKLATTEGLSGKLNGCSPNAYNRYMLEDAALASKSRSRTAEDGRTYRDSPCASSWGLQGAPVPPAVSGCGVCLKCRLCWPWYRCRRYFMTESSRSIEMLKVGSVGEFGPRPASPRFFGMRRVSFPTRGRISTLSALYSVNLMYGLPW